MTFDTLMGLFILTGGPEPGRNTNRRRRLAEEAHTYARGHIIHTRSNDPTVGPLRPLPPHHTTSITTITSLSPVGGCNRKQELAYGIFTQV